MMESEQFVGFDQTGRLRSGDGPIAQYVRRRMALADRYWDGLLSALRRLAAAVFLFPVIWHVCWLAAREASVEIERLRYEVRPRQADGGSYDAVEKPSRPNRFRQIGGFLTLDPL